MAPPTWVTGQVLASADVNNWFVPLAAYKLASTGRSSTTLSIDPDLQVTVAANAFYEVSAAIIYQAASTSVGIKWGWVFPGTVTGEFAAAYADATVTAANCLGFAWTTTQTATNTTTSAYGINLKGALFTGVSGGTFGLNWASNIATTMNVNLGSSLVLRRIG
jgi:hypothetical protein